MILEGTTLVMFVLVLVLKYAAVTRLLRLNQKLREAEGRCRKQREILKAHRYERLVAEREEEGLARKQAILAGELHRVSDMLEGLKKRNGEMVQELMKKNARLGPELEGGADEQAAP